MKCAVHPFCAVQLSCAVQTFRYIKPFFSSVYTDNANNHIVVLFNFISLYVIRPLH